MKRITVLAVGLFLLLSGVALANGRSSADKNDRNLSVSNALPKQAIKQNRAARRKVRKFAGRWQGTLYQPGSPLREKYGFMMRLYRKGRTVSGFSRITITDSPQYFGVMRLRGTVRKNRLLFTEFKITRENIQSDSRWCIKSGSLKLTSVKGRLTLRGAWHAPDCTPGTIVLRKVFS